MTISLRSVLVDAAVRILGVNLEDPVGSCDSPSGPQPSTDLGVIPLVAGVRDLARVDSCRVVPSLWVSNSRIRSIRSLYCEELIDQRVEVLLEEDDG